MQGGRTPKPVGPVVLFDQLFKSWGCAPGAGRNLEVLGTRARRQHHHHHHHHHAPTRPLMPGPAAPAEKIFGSVDQLVTETGGESAAGAAWGPGAAGRVDQLITNVGGERDGEDLRPWADRGPVGRVSGRSFGRRDGRGGSGWTGVVVNQLARAGTGRGNGPRWAVQ